jgi:hypothetical protein
MEIFGRDLMWYTYRILYNIVYIYHHIISISLIYIYHNQNYLSIWVLRVLIFVRMGLSRTWSFFLTQHHFGGFLKWGCRTNGCVFFHVFLMENPTQIWMNRGTNLHFSISCQKLDSIHSDVCTFWYTNCDMAWVSSILRQTHVSMLVDVGCISHCPMISKSYSTISQLHPMKSIQNLDLVGLVGHT